MYGSLVHKMVAIRFIFTSSLITLISMPGGIPSAVAFAPSLLVAPTPFQTSFGFIRHQRPELRMAPPDAHDDHDEDEDDDDHDGDGDEGDPLSKGIDSVTWLPSLANQSTKTITAVRNVSMQLCLHI